MSGVSYNEKCPNCGEDMSCYADSKPIDVVSGQCLSCGFYYSTQCAMMTKDELDATREELSWDGNDKFDEKKKVEDFI